MPVLWVCEDNGLGISVNTPAGWIGSRYAQRREMAYFRADGTDPVDTFDRAREAVEHVRARREPAFLHLKLVRLLGHAGTDPELAYLDIETIKRAESRDPLLRSCATAMEQGFATGTELLALYDEIGERVSAAGEEAARRPHQKDAASIAAPLSPHHPEAVEERAAAGPPADLRLRHWGDEGRLPERRDPEPLGRLINFALHDLMLQYPGMLAFGEDVARRGGVYGVTSGLWQRFGGGRVFNTLLDEQSVLGLAIGAGHVGFLPVPEIQYLAYLHNAIDQLRGEAASLQFFSDGQFRNPMVVRIASFGYQRGFGGHFHNDNAIGALREIPGVTIAAPARGDDAVEMLRTALAMAQVDGSVVLFMEPIALYATRDLHEPGDGEWSCRYPAPGGCSTVGRARVYGPETADLAIVSWANGLWRSLRAARQLEQRGIATRVVDLRWLQPFDRDAVIAEARAAGRLLVVDEGRRTGGLSEAILAAVAEAGDGAVVARLCGEDTFIPLGPAWEQVLPSEEGIVAAAHRLVEGGGPAEGRR
jgi:2-oxoisovalerate dehydrogenase E1 component